MAGVKKALSRLGFVKKSAALTSVALLPTLFSSPALKRLRHQGPTLKRPHILPQGSTLGLVAPASGIDDALFQRAIQQITSLGYRIKYTPQAQARKGFLAGNDKDRWADLQAAFMNPDIDGIVCLRGGYGTSRILSHINPKLLLKPFMGFSDITALGLVFYQRLRWLSIHGPMPTSVFTPFTLQHIKKMLQEGGKGMTLRAHKQPEDPKIIVSNACFAIREGFASGRLLGGNLTVICSLLGTPYMPDFSGCIVFLEDVGERPYRIDRLLTQLIMSGVLSQARGIALGTFVDCEEGEYFQPSNPVYLYEVLEERLKPLGIPVVYGLPFGHVADHVPLPQGGQGALDATKKTLYLTEEALLTS